MTAVTVPATQGFFWDDTVTPETVTDLLSAVAAAQALSDAIPTYAAAALASQVAAAASQTAAAASASGAATSASAAATSASGASSSATAASGSATAAATSATNAATSASGASTSASGASSSATSASGSATSATNSATAAATSATNAGNSATAASNSAAAAAATLADAVSKSTAVAQTITSDITHSGATTLTGATTANGTLTANNTVTMSPASHNVTLSPTGTGQVIINPATAGTIDNMALGGTTRGAAKVTTLDANGATTVVALTATGLITPSTTVGIKGTAAADNAQAGSNGEEIISQMTGAGATVTITNATPAVVTWTSHPLATGHGITFTTTGGLPTGLSPNVAYYAIVVNANTFRVATSVANAFAGTAVATSSAGSGTHTCISILAVATAGTVADIMGVQLTAGDWEVSGALGWSASAAGAITFAAGWINTTSVTDPGVQTPAYSLIVAAGTNSYGNHSLAPKRINVSSTTTVFLSGKMGSASQAYGYGVIRARRLR